MAGLRTFTLSVILGLILFVSCSSSRAARKPLTASISSITLSKPHKTAIHTLAPIASPLTKDGEEGIFEGEEEDDDECSGLEMECLKRRSLVAHTDYIYTQDINNGP